MHQFNARFLASRCRKVRGKESFEHQGRGTHPNHLTMQKHTSIISPVPLLWCRVAVEKTCCVLRLRPQICGYRTHAISPCLPAPVIVLRRLRLLDPHKNKLVTYAHETQWGHHFTTKHESAYVVSMARVRSSILVRRGVRNVAGKTERDVSPSADLVHTMAAGARETRDGHGSKLRSIFCAVLLACVAASTATTAPHRRAVGGAWNYDR